MSKRIAFGFLVAAAFGTASMVVPAAAQDTSYAGIVTFGDSLSDNGNLFAATGGLSPTSPPYFNGRFSNGIVWTELLAQQLSAAELNFAYGGARSDLIGELNNLTATFPVAPYLGGSAGNFPPGVPMQIEAALAQNGPIAPDEAATTLFTLWGGANNMLDFFRAGIAPTDTNNALLPGFIDPTVPANIQANSIAAATDMVGNLQSLIGLGAQNILVANLPNLGAAPAFNTTQNGRDGGFLASATFNTALDQGVQAVAAAVPGVNIIQMDVEGAFNVILNNPAAYGFANVTDACLATPACAGASVAEQNKFLFWDAVHPTAAGHQLIALYAGLLLTTTERAAAVATLPETGIWSQLNAGSAIFDRLSSWLEGSYAHQNGLYAEVIGSQGEFDAVGNRPSSDFSLYGVRAGLDHQFDNSIVGAALSVMSGDHSQTGFNGELMSFGVDLYASSYMGPLYISGRLGGAHMLMNDLTRATGFGPLQAVGETEGRQYGGAVEVGALLPVGGGLSLTPSARVGHITSRVDGYEEHAAILALAYEDREVTTNFWSAGLRAAANLGGLSAYAEGGYEDFFSYQSDAVVAQLVGNTALPVSLAIDDPAARGWFFKLGASGNVTETVSVDVDYGMSLQDGDGQIHTGKVRMKIKTEGLMDSLK